MKKCEQQKTLSIGLKIMLTGVALALLAVYAVVLPSLGRAIIARYPEFSGWFWPWLLFLWGTGLPCLAALCLCGKIARNYVQERTFSDENVRLLQWISRLAIGDAVYFLLGNVTMLLLNMHHPAYLMLSLFVVFAGAVLAAVAALLSHAVRKGAELQELNEGTI